MGLTVQFVLFIHLVFVQSKMTKVSFGGKFNTGYCVVHNTSVEPYEIPIRERCTHLELYSVNLTQEVLNSIVTNRLKSLELSNSSVDIFSVPSTLTRFEYRGIPGCTTQIIIDEHVYKLEHIILKDFLKLSTNIGKLRKLKDIYCYRAREANLEFIEFNEMLQLHTIDIRDIASVTVRGSAYLPALRWMEIIGTPMKLINNASFEFPIIQELHLHNNSLQLIPDQFSTFAKLKSLHICSNKLRYVTLDVFANLSRLEVLYLTDNEISNITAENQVKLPNLRKFSLASNKLTSLNCTLWLMPALQFFSIDNNQLYRVDGLLELFTENLSKFIWRVNNSITFIADVDGGCTLGRFQYTELQSGK